MIGLGFTIGVELILSLGLIVNGFVLCLLWGWFMVPTFGVVPIHVIPAIGMVMVARILIPSTRSRGEQKTVGRMIMEGSANTIFKPLITLFLDGLYIFCCKMSLVRINGALVELNST